MTIIITTTTVIRITDARRSAQGRAHPVSHFSSAGFGIDRGEYPLGCLALLDPVDDSREGIEPVRGDAAPAALHARNVEQARELLRAVETAILAREPLVPLHVVSSAETLEWDRR
jgi:hypothetical protein